MGRAVCDLCNVKSFVRRFNRCRLCGRMVCSGCAQTRVRVGIFREERICCYCFDTKDRLQNEERNFLVGLPIHDAALSGNRRDSIASTLDGDISSRCSVVSAVNASSEAGETRPHARARSYSVPRLGHAQLQRIYSGVIMCDESSDRRNSLSALLPVKTSPVDQSENAKESPGSQLDGEPASTSSKAEDTTLDCAILPPLLKIDAETLAEHERQFQIAMNTPIPDDSDDDWLTPKSTASSSQPYLLESDKDDEKASPVQDDEKVSPAKGAKTARVTGNTEDRDESSPDKNSPRKTITSQKHTSALLTSARKNMIRAPPTLKARAQPRLYIPTPCRAFPPEKQLRRQSHTSFGGATTAGIDEAGTPSSSIGCSAPGKVCGELYVKRSLVWAKRYAVAEGPTLEYRKSEIARVRLRLSLPEFTVEYLGHLTNGYGLSLKTKNATVTPCSLLLLLVPTKQHAEEWFRVLWWGSRILKSDSDDRFQKAVK